MLAERESAFAIQARVFHALMMRDMRTRFGRSHWGYAIAVLWPFAHVFVVAGILVFRGLPTPIGHSTLLFVTTGIVPFLTFNYMSRKVMESLAANRPLTYFPRVKTIDILLSRIVIEFVTSAASAICCMVFLALLGVDPFPVYPADAIYAFLATIVLSAGIGMLNACILVIFPPYNMGYVLIIISLYSLSGCFFVPEFLPAAAYDILSWNPLLQCISWMRSAYYPAYNPPISRIYVLVFGFALIAFGLMADRFFLRRFQH